MTSAFTGKLTQKSVQVAKKAEIGSAFLPIFMRRRRYFFQRIWLMCPKMKKIQRNVVMQELALHVDAVS